VREILGPLPWFWFVGQIRCPTPFLGSINEGIYGHLSVRNLPVLTEERGDRRPSRAPAEDGCRRVSIRRRPLALKV
jgi:hypothetical protein